MSFSFLSPLPFFHSTPLNNTLCFGMAGVPSMMPTKMKSRTSFLAMAGNISIKPTFPEIRPSRAYPVHNLRPYQPASCLQKSLPLPLHLLHPPRRPRCGIVVAEIALLPQKPSTAPHLRANVANRLMEWCQIVRPALLQTRRPVDLFLLIRSTLHAT